MQDKPPPQSEDKEVDELDEYLKELQLRESTDASTDEQSVINATPQPPSNSNLSFVILLYWFLAILNLGSATYCKHNVSELFFSISRTSLTRKCCRKSKDSLTHKKRYSSS